MAKRKRDRQRITIDHFRGVHQEINPDDYTYSRAVMGLVDEHGGMLARLGGKISAGSNPMSSIWGLHQLRFKDNWGIVVHNGSSRDWYDHNAYKGPEDGFIITTPTADPTFEVIPADILPGDNWPHEPPKAPCHSDIAVHYGIYELPVDDLLICRRSIAGNGSSTGWKSTLLEAYDTEWNTILNWPAFWTWTGWTRVAVGSTLLFAPFFRVVVSISAGGSYHVRISFAEIEMRPCSDTLASPPSTPWGGSYNHARWSGGGIFFDDLSSYIGNPLAACTGTTCANLVTPTAQGGIDKTAASALSRASIPGFTDTDAGVYNNVLNSQVPTWDGDLTNLTLYAEGGWFEHVDSCFEE